jgi:1,2-diacylglycerol 3-alpha-glucosyltransferase
MKILYVTNSFTPHVGGVARSVEAFTAELRKQGVDVHVVAPTYEGTPENEPNVLRVPAVQNFNGSDFSVAYPLTGLVRTVVDDFKPDVIHSHHPFVLGATAFRIARATQTPLVFTHHTMYEQYTHYVPGDSPVLKRFAIQLATSYANLCQHVIAPSESIRDVIQERGVKTPVTVIPTGVHCEKFAEGSGSGFRKIIGIPEDAFVVGHVGRLAKEKNLDFLSKAVASFLQAHPDAHFLLVGSGAHEDAVISCLHDAGVDERVHWTGALTGRFLVSAYRAMDVFAFASHSETQGMVITEAMAAGAPVVAIDAPGVREVVNSGVNGIMLEEDSVEGFVEALHHFATTPASMASSKQGSLETADSYSIQNSTRKMISVYEKLIAEFPARHSDAPGAWERTMRMAETEWDVIKEFAEAASHAISP